MTKIKNYVEQIDEELEGAKDYAEKYIEHKAKNNTNWANKYKEMATDELKHAGYVHDFTVYEIEELEKVYKPTEEMREKYEKAHRKYVERVAWIKQMLTM